MSFSLNDSIKKLSGVGQARAALYEKLGVDTVYSLLRFYPRTYIDFSHKVDIANIVPEEVNVIKATVIKKMNEARIRKGLSIFKVVVADTTGTVTIVIFNNVYMFEAFKEGEEYILSGKISVQNGKKEMPSPTFISANEPLSFLPIYHLTQGLSNKMVQANVKQAMLLWGDTLDDVIPLSVKIKNNLCQYRYALENIHFPKDETALKISRDRLVFEELLILQLGLLQLKARNRQTTGNIINSVDMTPFYSSLPFKLTQGQLLAIDDALCDMQKETPMNRLVQGDVGCGKTVVAAALCYACAKNGVQSALMAPTEILAVQHFNTLTEVLKPLGIRCCLLVGATSKKEKEQMYEDIAAHKYDLVIGTHAIIQERVEFKKLGLVITDEQHRFGVEQRQAFCKKGVNVHVLVMSATPIPRTLALIIYGDLDISVIKELPQGRQPVKTYLISSSKRQRALGFLKEQIETGRQAYIVCPLIDENESDMASVNEYFKQLQSTVLAGVSTGLLHGKLKSAEKEKIMEDFKDNKIKLLVCTTVVEVGVDVKGATVMMIENAERFGLSALHQLRGRVGRSNFLSYCILISDLKSETNLKRLKVMTSTNDGFLVANEDLKLRGPGDFFGQKQHGLPNLAVANLIDDIEVLHKTQQIAREIIKSDPLLENNENKGLKTLVELLFKNNEDGGFN